MKAILTTALIFAGLGAAAARAQTPDATWLEGTIGGAEGAAGQVVATLDCMDTEAILERANRELRTYRANRESFPDILPLRTHLDAVYDGIDGDGKTTRRLFVETFARPEPFFYRVIPGVELGMDFDRNSLIYVCLDTTKEVAKRALYIYFLSGTDLDQSFWSKFRKPEIRVSRRNVRSRPASGFVDLLGKVPGFETIFEFLNASLVRPGEEIVNGLFSFIDRWGVERLVVTPTEIIVNSQHRTALNMIPWGAEDKIPFESKWLLDDDFDDKVNDKVDDSR